MELKVTSEDLGVLRIIFDSLLKDDKGTLEVIAGSEYATKLSWSEITKLHRQYGQVTIEYGRPDYK